MHVHLQDFVKGELYLFGLPRSVYFSLVKFLFIFLLGKSKFKQRFRLSGIRLMCGRVEAVVFPNKIDHFGSPIPWRECYD